jgi:hypothetical protein
MTQWGRNNCYLIFNKHTVVLDGALYFNIYCDLNYGLWSCYTVQPCGLFGGICYFHLQVGKYSVKASLPIPMSYAVGNTRRPQSEDTLPQKPEQFRHKHRTTRCQNSENHNINRHRRENWKVSSETSISTNKYPRFHIPLHENNQQMHWFFNSLLFYSAAPTCFDTCVSSSGSSSVSAESHANRMQWLIRLCVIRCYVSVMWRPGVRISFVSHVTQQAGKSALMMTHTCRKHVGAAE